MITIRKDIFKFILHLQTNSSAFIKTVVNHFQLIPKITCTMKYKMQQQQQNTILSTMNFSK